MKVKFSRFYRWVDWGSFDELQMLMYPELEDELYSASDDELIRLSILKFQAIKRKFKSGGTPQWNGNLTCPLCVVYMTDMDSYNYSCGDCPIAKKTGLIGCVGTPYKKLATSEYGEDYPDRVDAEINFLKSLLED